MAKLICSLAPSVQKVRMTCSGNRGVHVRHPPGARLHQARQNHQIRRVLPRPRGLAACQSRLGRAHVWTSDSAGVPAAFTQHTIVLPFNDTETVKAAFAANKKQIAGIIVEPVPGNAGLYLPKPGYLEFLREITKATARC